MSLTMAVGYGTKAEWANPPVAVSPGARAGPRAQYAWGVSTPLRPGLMIAWMPVSRRSTTIASRAGFELMLLGRSGFRRPWSAPFAYPALAWRTVRALATHRPDRIIVVAPPVVAPLVVLPIAWMLRARVAIDLHSGALLDRRWRWAVPILAWLARRSTAAVVTLPSLAAALEARGVQTIVLPDPLPELGFGNAAAHPGPAGPPEVVAICGWGDDEPLEALVDAAAGQPWTLALTGRPRRPLELPDGVRLTGFMDDAAYADTLARAAAIVVLTTRDETLLSGAWEAIAVGRPLVLSGTTALRSTFGDGPTYVGDDTPSIAAGIASAVQDPEAATRTRALRDRFGAANDAALARLTAALRGDANG
jgi:glycosyltransferase involved in cell wall biosynthesis